MFDFEGKDVRVVLIDDEPWFVLTDVCRAVELSNPSQVKTRLDDGVISNEAIKDSVGRTQQATVINEDGLYDVIFESRKPEAKRFRKWVTSDVLPKIRKDGMYISEDATYEQINYNVDVFFAGLSTRDVTTLYDHVEQFLSYHREKKTKLPYERKSFKRHGNKKYKDHIESMEVIRDQLVDFLNGKIDQFNGTNQAGLAQEYVRIREMVRVKVENMRYRTAACR